MALELCTLFDANYLPRALVCFRSLAAVCDDFRLHVLCMDDEAKHVLDRLGLPGVDAFTIAELEAHDPELAAVRSDRQPVEYFWTATPALCLYCLERSPDAASITYLDADLQFFADPGPVLARVAHASVVLTPHQYAPGYRHLEAESGTYNVQFLTFRRDDRGLAALRWWRERCIEWCYARVEDGKMGDQKYLDDWPERFEGVHVLGGVEAGLAPWNGESFRLERRNGELLADGEPVLFYHFHSLRLFRGIEWLRRLGLFRSYRWSSGLLWTAYPLSREQRQLVWEPYLALLRRELDLIRTLRPGFEGGFARVRPVAMLLRAARFRAAAARERLRSRRGLAETWKDADVARQMVELADRGLEDPDAVPPLRVFLTAVETLLDRDDLPRPARILDFGCGVGHYGELLERRHPGRFEYVGCDYSEAMVATARARSPERRFEVNDLFANRIDLGSFDVVLASALVDVLDRHDEALAVLLGSSAPHVILHRQRITEGASRVEVVPGYEGQRTFASFLSLDDLERIAAAHGRRIAARFRVDEAIWSFILSVEPR